MKLRRFQLGACRVEDLRRLCQWMGIDGSSDMERTSLMAWLIYEGWAG